VVCAEKNQYNVKRSGRGLHTVGLVHVGLVQGDVSGNTSAKRVVLDQTVSFCCISRYAPGPQIDSLFPFSPRRL
jgi:hypothetical protein